MERHLKGHDRSSYFTCNVCGKVAARWDTLKIHYRTHAFVVPARSAPNLQNLSLGDPSVDDRYAGFEALLTASEILEEEEKNGKK